MLYNCRMLGKSLIRGKLLDESACHAPQSALQFSRTLMNIKIVLAHLLTGIACVSRIQPCIDGSHTSMAFVTPTFVKRLA